MTVDGATVAHDVHELADVVVVGSGAGGAVVARELAGRRRDVVLVEEGGFHTGKDFTGEPRRMIDLLYRNRGVTGTLGTPPGLLWNQYGPHRGEKARREYACVPA